MKLLYDTITSSLKPYPRSEDNPVICLDPRYLEMAVIQESEPSYDPQTHYINKTELINTENKTVTRGWEILPIVVPPPSPDWQGFYDALIASAVYGNVLTQATQSTELIAYLLAFVAALADAKAGRPNIPAIQSAINLVMSSATIDASGLSEIEVILASSHLDDVLSLPIN